jgi:aryl-alcohol dehydrogenase-like predicted oxidoreductase
LKESKILSLLEKCEAEMEKRQFGKTDMMVSVLGFGGAEIGFQGVDVSEVKSILNNALDAGLNVVDTAECYVNSEEMIGNTVSHRRDDFYLFTKCGHGENFDVGAWSKVEILSSIERSLKRLKTDRLDLVLLHSCSEEELRKGEVIEALQAAKAAGKTRYIGYSGDSFAALYAIESGAFDALQTSVNIADQEALELTLPKAKERSMGVIAKRPVANVAWKEKTKPEYFYIQEYWARFQKLKYDFLNGDLSEAVNTALRFTLSVDGVHTAIVGTTKKERWQENARMLQKGSLSESEIAAIRKIWSERAQQDWVGQV